MLCMLNCRMFRLLCYLLAYCSVLYICGLLFVVVLCWCACMWWLTLKCVEWLTYVLAVWCFVCVVLLGALWMLHFHVSVYYLMLIPLHFMCVLCVGVMLQRIDSWERVMFLLHEGHVYFVCCPGLLSSPPQVWVLLEGPTEPADPRPRRRSTWAASRNNDRSEVPSRGQGWGCWRGLPSSPIGTSSVSRRRRTPTVSRPLHCELWVCIAVALGAPSPHDQNSLDFEIWSYLECKVSTVHHQSLEGIKIKLRKEWAKILQKVSCDSCKVFSKRLQLVIDADGGHIESYFGRCLSKSYCA